VEKCFQNTSNYCIVWNCITESCSDLAVEQGWIRDQQKLCYLPLEVIWKDWNAGGRGSGQTLLGYLQCSPNLSDGLVPHCSPKPHPYTLCLTSMAGSATDVTSGYIRWLLFMGKLQLLNIVISICWLNQVCIQYVKTCQHLG